MARAPGSDRSQGRRGSALRGAGAQRRRRPGKRGSSGAGSREPDEYRHHMARVQRADDDVGRLVSGRLSRTAAGEVCPDAEVLAAYVDSGLADEEIARVEAHLATCASCRALMARLSPIEAAAPAAAAPTARFFSDRCALGRARGDASSWRPWPGWPGRAPTPAPATTMARNEVAAAGGATPAAAPGLRRRPAPTPFLRGHRRCSTPHRRREPARRRLAPRRRPHRLQPSRSRKPQ